MIDVNIDITEVCKRVGFESIIIVAFADIIYNFIHCVHRLDLRVLCSWCSWNSRCNDFSYCGSLFGFFELSLKVLNELIFFGTVGV